MNPEVLLEALREAHIENVNLKLELAALRAAITPVESTPVVAEGDHVFTPGESDIT